MKRAGSLPLVLLAFAGSLFCLFSLWDTSGVFCLNTGCSIYKGYEIFGISFYWIGVFFFLFLGVLALLSRERLWLRFFAVLGLLGNILFLLYQIFYWPCSSCLMVALFLGLFAFFLFRRAAAVWRRLFAVWLLFFIAAGLGAVRDGVQPSVLIEREQPEMEVFFSATCPACKSLIKTLLEDPDLFGKTALYPVLKAENDLARIVFLKKMLDAKMPPEEAFNTFWEEEIPPSLSLKDRFFHRLAFEKNRIIFARMGGDRIPLILSARLAYVGKADVSEPPANLGSCSISSEGAGSCGTDGGQTFLPKAW